MKAKTKKGVSMLTILFVLLGISQAFRLTYIMLQKTKEPTIISTSYLVQDNMISNIIEEKEKTEEKKEEPIIKKEEPVIKEVAKETKQQEPIVTTLENSNQYRLTSFYSNDGYGTGSCTGAGLCEKDFQINDKGWYTYQGYLVLAGATTQCLNTKSGACGKWNTNNGRKYFSYYDKIVVNIDGVAYNGIVLDSCGACMYVNENRLDLFVSNKSSAIDRGYKGNNMITVSY